MLNVDSLCKEGIVTPELYNVEIITGIDNGFLRSYRAVRGRSETGTGSENQWDVKQWGN